jgi:spermidine synthase
VAWACLVVFVANGALLVLQLVAGRLLAPFIGSSLETWTSVIGVFLAGISLGNWLGGKLADGAASEITLGQLLLGGAGAMVLTLGIVYVIGLSGGSSALQALPLYPRIALLTIVTCLPPSLVLSMITPVAIKLLLPDVAHTGRVAGLVYALGTLGSLAGNFLTGFVLLAYLTTYVTVLGAAGLLGILGALTLFSIVVPPGSGEIRTAKSETRGPKADGRNSKKSARPGSAAISQPALSLRAACALVFVCSFCSMALEIAASRFLAPHLGVSLYSWTGIIGVVLAGVMLGNFVGGRVADQSPTLETLGSCLFFAGVFTLAIQLLSGVLGHAGFVEELGLITRILVWTAALFFIPMFLLGTVSPQVTRLAVTDWDHAGRVAGRIYAWSCAGAIAGTFATGWGGIMLLKGVGGVILAAGLVLVVLAAILDQPWRRPAELFIGAIVVSAALLGLHFREKLTSPYDLETNYYAIDHFDTVYQGEEVRALKLDLLIHSYVKGQAEYNDAGKVKQYPNGDDVFIADTTFMGYPHEEVQADFARWAVDRAGKDAHLMVIGGGGYTYPRWVEATLPMSVEVVEIDPGVTEVAHRKLGLKRDTKIVSHHMDGRQFVQEKAKPGHYQLIVQDAVNDLSVPYHILTKEYNDAIKRVLTDDGVFLLTVIDEYEEGLLMRAAVRTMRETFKYVNLLASTPLWEEDQRAVYVIYGSMKPFDRDALAKAIKGQNAGDVHTLAMPDDALNKYLDRRPAPVLTDAYAPVDNLISVAFRKR